MEICVKLYREIARRCQGGDSLIEKELVNTTLGKVCSKSWISKDITLR